MILKSMRLRIAIMLLAIPSAIVAIEGPHAPAASATRWMGEQRCAPSLMGNVVDLPGLVIDQASVIPAGWDNAGQAVPAHCELIAKLDPHVGVDGQAYAIRFHLRLPADWNGRFFFQGGGGSDGVLGDALGNIEGRQPASALQLGYAVVSQDAGHDNTLNQVAEHGGQVSFGWDPRAREDYAFRSQARVTVAAKQLISAFYGEGPRYSYWVGCSKGGQEGMALAQRFPSYFDGVIADAPAFAFPKSVLTQAWDTQAIARVAERAGAKDAAGLPLLNSAFSDADLGLVSKAVAQACDRLDGLADGIVADFAACTSRRVVPGLEKMRCIGAKTSDCLSTEQIAALQRIFRGPRNAKGEPLYSDWAWDIGIGGTFAGRTYSGWRAWKLGSINGKENDALSILMGSAALATLLTVPPTPLSADTSARLRYLLSFDFDRDAQRIYAVEAPYATSAWDLFSAQGMLSGFRAQGGKLIIVQGVSDAAFSIRDTARWWDRLDRRYRGHAADFARLYAVPGMGHCRDGPGTTTFDAFTSLVDWVEKGRSPERIIATAPAQTPWPGRTRPLCPYPKVAIYKGSGNIEKASSFICQRRRSVSG